VKAIAILGSTGSIGLSTLEVARSLADRIKVVGLSAGRNIDRLNQQIAEFRPVAVAVAEEAAVSRVRPAPGRRTEVYWGDQGLARIAAMEEADLVVNALVGSAGIVPTLAAIRAGRSVALANKECLVAAGQIITAEARKQGQELIPIDSEHSAIFQCMRCEARKAVSRIILTASGGPLVDMAGKDLRGVNATEALRHPTWSMGRKVTIDSATLLNKGFEVIEAHWLFGVDPDHIEVVVERKSVVHSMVEFVDGSVMAVLSPPDMRLPIQYALTYPDRIRTSLARLDLVSLGPVGFEAPDERRFPCLTLAYQAARLGGTVPAVLSAADEIAVDAFLSDRIVFGDIYRILSRVVAEHEAQPADDLDSILDADRWARLKALGLLKEIQREE
jgi:1-deoxy-D-xylulose-5-phosphate reductoisomerase